MEYLEYMEQYDKEHYCCPKCHSKNNSSTLVGYIYDPTHPEDYKDCNSVHCYTCGWNGIKHDMVPKPEKIGYRIAYLRHNGRNHRVELCENYDDKIYQCSSDEMKEIVKQIEKDTKHIDYLYFYEVEIK